MKIRTQSGQLVDITGKVTTTVRLPDGSFQILLHTKDKKEGDILGGYSTEPKQSMYSAESRWQSGIRRRSEYL